MDAEKLVKQYIDAWNQREVAGLLDLMHPGAAYYDAFWMESCVGRDLAQYFRDEFDEEPYWYEQVGDVIATENGVSFRYSAHDPSDANIGDPIHYGAEVLQIRDSKILTVTDFYCSTIRDDLEEVAKLAVRHHGMPTHVSSGLGALKTMRIRSALSTEIEKDEVYLDPNISLSKLAAKIGCSLDQLSIVISREFGTSFAHVMDARRIEHAKKLLQSYPDDPNILKQVSGQAGFKSYKEFCDKFTDFLGCTPTDYCHQQRQKDDSDNNSYLN